MEKGKGKMKKGKRKRGKKKGEREMGKGKTEKGKGERGNGSHYVIKDKQKTEYLFLCPFSESIPYGQIGVQ